MSVADSSRVICKMGEIYAITNIISNFLLPLAFRTCTVNILTPSCHAEDPLSFRILHTELVQPFLVFASSPEGHASAFARTSMHVPSCVVVIASAKATHQLEHKIKALAKASVLLPQTDFLVLVEPPGNHHTESEITSYKTVLELMKNVVTLTAEDKHSVAVNQLCPHCPSGAVPIALHAPGQEGENLSTQSLLPDTYRNFYGKTLYIAFFTSAINSQFREVNGTARVYKTGGYNLRSSITICETLNATWAIRPHRRYSFKKVNGSFVEGFFKDFQDGTAHMGAMGITLYSFYRVADLAFPVDANYVTFFTASPEPFHSWADITRPLSYPLWLGICLALAVTLIALRLLQQIAQCCGLENVFWWRWSKELYFLTSSLLLQSNDLPRKMLIYRVVVPWWCFFVIVVTTAYSGKLFSSFAFPSLRAVPQTFTELGLTPQYRIGYADLGGGGATTKIYLRNYKEGSPERNIPGRIELWKPRDCLNAAIEQHGFACMSMASNVESYMVRVCSTTRQRDCLVKHKDAVAMHFYHALAFPKGSFLIETADRVMGPLVAAGMIQKWIDQTNLDLRKEKLELGEKVWTERKTDEAEPLKMKHLKYTFALCAIGHFLSVCSHIGNAAVLRFIARVITVSV